MSAIHAPFMSHSSAGTEKLPYHGPCFVCGPDNPDGLGLDWFATNGRIHTRFRFGEAHQGPRNFVHGGATAAVLDEAMGAAAWLAGHRVLAASLSVDFREPVPLEVEVQVEAWLTHVDGRKAFTKSHLLLRGSEKVLAEATGIFVSVPDFFDRASSAWSGDGEEGAPQTAGGG